MSTSIVSTARNVVVSVVISASGAAVVACGAGKTPSAPTPPESVAAVNATPSGPAAPGRTQSSTTTGDFDAAGDAIETNPGAVPLDIMLGPVPDDVIVRWAGLDWIWASPCSGSCSTPSPSTQPGFRYATSAEFANKPDFHLFLNAVSENQAQCTYPMCKCAAAWFESLTSRQHCDPVNARDGLITSELNGSFWRVGSSAMWQSPTRHRRLWQPLGSPGAKTQEPRSPPLRSSMTTRMPRQR